MLRLVYGFIVAFGLIGATDAGAQGRSPFDGFYVGAQIGSDDVMSKVKTDNATVEDGWTDKDALSYGGFLGYGLTFNKTFYLGAELSYTISNHHFYSFIDTPGGYFQQDLELNNTFAAMLRAGTVVGNSLVYLKGGAVNSEFQFACCMNFLPQVDDKKRAWGLGLGGGIEAYLGGGLSLRADYTFAKYDSVSFTDMQPRTVQFDTIESTLQFGLAYHFNSVRGPVEHANFAGWYGGVFGAYSNFASGPLLPDDGQISASAHGTGIGLLGGYRAQFQRWVLGLEVDGALHDVEYADPAFGQSHHMKNSYGIAVQAGYVIGNTLLFAKVGAVRSVFDSTFAGVFAKDTHNGVQYGAGMETALSRHLSLRLDLTRGEYESKTFTDGLDVFTMDPTVSTSRAAIIYRY